ncbi:MAG: PQQ-binding-like beta-propeller repeat protein [Firmicutes bacterium]|nr:PQQ-binding-like beta-propeller repeat protein [Bacillota bacterium]
MDATQPSKLLKSTAVKVGGTIVDSYQAADPIDFGLGQDYTSLEGIVSFRGNNFREGSSYGAANITQQKFGASWKIPTGTLSVPGTSWSGQGWTGQPLCMTWPKDLRQHMNLYDWAKRQDVLHECVYASEDGNIYFFELETGKLTRNTLHVGYCFKGSGALDPRGYPILYVGAGYDSFKGTSHVFIFDLMDCSILYEFGANDPFAIRKWSCYDSGPLVDAATDQLIYPAESGILYIVKLNSQFDPAAGTVSVNITPSDFVRWRYNGVRTGGAYWLGMEDSCVIFRGHIIVADNGGNLMCLNLNTLTVDWVQNVLDDTNDSPVLELEDGHPYIYISTSFHLGWRSSTTAPIPVWKIDAVTGEVVWSTDSRYMCHTVSDLSGGVQGTIGLGKNKLSGLIFVPVADYPGAGNGQLVALDKQTGEEVWHFQSSAYAWSSPTVCYDAAGNGYVIYCTTAGSIVLLDGLTGAKLDVLDAGSNIEATPIVFNGYLVVGTRSNGIWGTQLT